MAKPLTAAKNSSQMSLNNSNTSQLSVRMTVKYLKEHLDDEFVALFSHTDEMARHLADSFLENGFDESQPVHLAYLEDEDKEVVIDGMTRLHALELAKFFDVPVYRHTFKTRLEALMHAYRLQLDRRNLNDAQKIAAVEKMLLLKNPAHEGKTATAIAEQLGMSTRNVEKAINIIKNGDENTKQAVLNAQMSINAGDKATQRKKAVKNNSNEDDLADALEDTSGKPKAIVIGDHSDHIERPSNKLSAEEDSERTRERRKAYETGFFEGFLQAANYVLSAVVAEHALSSLYIDIFCNPAYHNYEQFTHMGANCYLDAEYKYSKFRKELLAERNLEDLNPEPIKEYSSQNGDLPLDFEKDNVADEKTSSVTDLSAFNIEFEDGDE
ncbi:MAG: hypothetical protein IKO39_01680 [Treponema sp.]|nr:hypothetical protein [Treponema sp.]